MSIGTTTIANDGQVRFGYGALPHLTQAIDELEIVRPLLCTDRGIGQAGLLEQAVSFLPDGVDLEVFDGTPANPTEEAVGVTR